MSAIDIREARPEDAAEIARVHIASWRAAYTGIVSQAWLDSQELADREGKWLANIKGERDKGQKIFLAFSGASLAAFATIGTSRSERYPDYAELWAIYADPAFYGKGAGKALFRRCADHVQEMGFDKMFVNVLRDNDLGRNFYERMGGVVIPGSEGEVELGDQLYKDIKYEWKELRYE